MQLNKIFRIFFIFVVFAVFCSIVVPIQVYAQQCGGDCSVAVCGNTTVCQADGTCAVVDRYCTACGGNGCAQSACPPGQYMPPNSPSCRAIDTGTGPVERPPRECNYSYINNCPAGYTRGNQVISAQYVSAGQMLFCGNAVGSAQSRGACSATVYDDGQGFDVCTEYIVYTYQCYPGCATGTTQQCSMVPTGQSTRVNSCHTPTNCGTGTYVSHYTSAGAGVCYIQSNPDDADFGNPVYNVITTCNTVAEQCNCISNCSQTAPTNLSVTDGTTPGRTAEVSWTLGAGGQAQYIWVDEDQVEVTAGCPTSGDCEASYQLSSATSRFPIGNLTPLTTYYIRIVNIGGPGCSSALTGTYTTPASTGAISGTVYLDASNTCAETSTLDNVSVVLDDVTTDTSGPSGAFSFAGLNLNSSHKLSASLPAGYICSTAPACSAYPCTVSGVVSPTSGKKFYLTQNKAAWWQTEGAGVYAGGAVDTTIGSTIPTSLDPLDKYLVIPGAIGSSGAVMHTSSTAPSLSAGEVNADGWQARTTYKGKRANYDFFKNEMGLTTTTDSLLNLNTMPANGPIFHYMNGSATLGGSGTSKTPWSVGATEKYVIFVNGDLNINADITVAPGGFAAFIVKGSINVASDVQNIQGLFVADQNFNTTSNGTTDAQLTVAGSVVAWGDVSLARDLVANNSNSPAELFVYRPDLLVNMPDEMKSFVMQWSEVVPGTYDEQ